LQLQLESVIVLYMSIQTEKDIQALKEIGRIVARCLKHMLDSIEVGMTTRELDALGADFLAKHGARSAPILAYNFPGHTCISLNHEAAHGIPGERKIHAGDLINIDVSAEKNGFFGDTGGSFVVPPVSAIKVRVCEIAKLALENALKVARAGQPLNLIGKAIEETAHAHKMTVIRNLGSHGVGRSLHEAPEFIPGFYDKNDRRILKEGMVMTIEPFISTGADFVEELEDGWTLATDKNYFTAQYEHSIIITNGEPIILTLPN
jgi:methionyl aminopeptidase